jgi:hypothetical protein
MCLSTLFEEDYIGGLICHKLVFPSVLRRVTSILPVVVTSMVVLTPGKQGCSMTALVEMGNPG